MSSTEKLIMARDEAETRAWDNLARYKFSNFGYWAAWYVKLNELLRETPAWKPKNPFRELVETARNHNKPNQEAEYPLFPKRSHEIQIHP